MTDETLKCPFCNGELLEIDKHEKIYDCQGEVQLLNLTLDCIAHDLYLQGWEDLVYKIISIKQKSYSDGYNRGMAEWLELTTKQTIEKVQQEIKHDLEILDQTAKLKQSWVDEGYEQGQQALFEYLASLDEIVLATVLNLGYEKYRPKKANKELES